MNIFLASVKSTLRKYATFDGTASRSEYWYFFLFGLILNVITYVTNSIDPNSIIDIVVTLAIFLPNLGVSIRRMHDTDHSGWFILVPFYNIYLLLKATTPNRWSTASFSPVE